MPLALTLLDGVRWHGDPVVGHRPQALLAALTSAGGRPVSNERLIEAVWADDVPANAGKALQVLVSRTRTLTDATAVVRDGRGYRLGIAREQVDLLRLDLLAEQARAALSSGDAVTARDTAAEAVALVGSMTQPGEDGVGPLADVRRAATHRSADVVGLLGQALGSTGEHESALPRLEDAWRRRPSDETLLAELLRSEAVVRGAGAALERYEGYRSALRDRLGSDPGEALQRVHRELLALDRPIRAGVLYDATPLVGRDHDVSALRSLIRRARVTSIVGAGGLGKTRLAHLLARGAEQPVVHFVELVGVAAPEDVVGEVGSALGVRDSVAGRHALSPEQRADVRARIAQQLDTAPTLLVLDNCEHLVTAVADLVAFLVATARDLTVVTTSRAPLAIGAEHVYLLHELDAEAAAELFRQRAVAARPDVQLDRSAGNEIVARLDGLPLAIELAAAKVRVMSVPEIARRLENRFALLRGGDRGAPDRHQTLIAVIDWSWNLLDDRGRRAMSHLSVFHDGFTLSGAESVLGTDSLEGVQALVDQSLLTVHDVGSLRYRMLETVREFGRMQLVDAGEDREAEAAQKGWALELARDTVWELHGSGQVEAVDAIRAEEANLSDVLRRAIAENDPDAVVELMAPLGGYWSIVGDHPRVITMSAAVAQSLQVYDPPATLADQARVVLATIVGNSILFLDTVAEEARDVLRRIGPGSSNPRVEALVRLMLTLAPAPDSDDVSSLGPSLPALLDHPSRHVRMLALQWMSHARENSGDPVAAIDLATEALALATDEDGPGTLASLHTQLAQMHMGMGEAGQAEVHARLALPVLERLRAVDDLVQMESLLLVCALRSGRVADAEAKLEQIRGQVGYQSTFGGRLIAHSGRAEVTLAKGDIAEGLRQYRQSATDLRNLRFPGLGPNQGFEPWTLFGQAAALTAYAVHAEGDDGLDLYHDVLVTARELLRVGRRYLDYPVAGLLFFALGTWGVRRGSMSPESSARLLALADRFAYNRTPPTMSWANGAEPLEQVAPGLLRTVLAEYGDQRGPQLREEALRVLAELPG